MLRTDRRTDRPTKCIPIIPSPLCGGGLKIVQEYEFDSALFVQIYHVLFFTVQLVMLHVYVLITQHVNEVSSTYKIYIFNVFNFNF